MQFMLVFIAVVVIGAAVFLTVGSRRLPWGRGEEHDGGIQGLAEPVPSLPPVLLPARPAPEDIDRMRLGVGLRGYRCDQVDEVIEVLSAEIGRLRAEVDDARRGPVISTTNQSPE